MYGICWHMLLVQVVYRLLVQVVYKLLVHVDVTHYFCHPYDR
jgi:hypothetical protein